MSMVKKDPRERITAQDALQNKWFTIAPSRVGMLSSALENMKKYHNKENENRFNMGVKKPQFSTVTRTPIMSSRFASNDLQDSYKILSATHAPSPSPKKDIPKVIKVCKLKRICLGTNLWTSI